jgi:hypothetical protein
MQITGRLVVFVPIAAGMAPYSEIISSDVTLRIAGSRIESDSICKTHSVAASLVVLFCTFIPLTTHPSQNNFASANRLGERGQDKLFIHMGETECAGQ